MSHWDPASEQALLAVALRVITAPVLLGILALKTGQEWLQTLPMEEPIGWFEQTLPPLDSEALAAREQSRSA